jgi:hypothetical protein
VCGVTPILRARNPNTAVVADSHIRVVLIRQPLLLLLLFRSWSELRPILVPLLINDILKKWVGGRLRLV